MNILPTDYTTQENAIAECLSDFGLRYEQQADFPPYKPDFYIPEIKMIIEADGKYGHLRRRDVKRDIALSKHTDVEYILHVRAFTKQRIHDTIMASLTKMGGEVTDAGNSTD